MTAAIRPPHETTLPVVCIHEDRLGNLPGVKLAVLSLARHAPRLQALVSCPGAGSDFAAWVGKQPNAAMVDMSQLGASGWNVKPAILLNLLESHPDLVWLDSDIIVTANIERYFEDLPDDAFVATQETFWGQQQGSRVRTLGWGLTPGRVFDCTINSGVMRVTRAHVDLLAAWRTMLTHPIYVRSQARPWSERPVHMIGDQEALTGLLGSADFAHVPVVLLRRGRDIAQCFGPSGFTPLERVQALSGEGPGFVHAMGPKPWSRPAKPPPLLGSGSLAKSLRAWYEYRSLDVSPYCIEARSYGGRSDIDVSWAVPRSALGRALTAFGSRRSPWPGLPLALFDHAARRVKRVLRIGRYSSSREFTLDQRPF